MKRYWLSLHQNTFLWIKGDNVCVYNSSNHRCVRWLLHGETIKRIIDTLLQSDNLYRASISEEQISNLHIKEWVDDLLEMKCADFIEDDGRNYCPVSFKPELIIRDTIDYYRQNYEISNDVDIMNNLHHLIIHLNGSKYGNDSYAKQVIFPTLEQSVLGYTDIVTFIESYGHPDFLAGISLVGCIAQYEDFSRLMSFLKKLNFSITIYCTEKDFYENSNFVKEQVTDEDIVLRLIISDYELVNSSFLESISLINNIYYDFIVPSEDEYETVESLVSFCQLDHYSIIPIYNGKNISFFEDDIYTTEDDISSLKLSKQEVFAHQAINTHFFGRLTILSNGEVFADTTKPVIGNIGEGLYPLVCREMMTGNAWFRIRDQKPCCDCVYQFLCPSPSHYEAVIGKFNLCHLYCESSMEYR